MIKQTLLAILFFTCSVAFSQDLNITNNLPASANTGEAIDAQYTLTKVATMGSFAKFQLDLPAGFQAQTGDIKGGNFTFENNRIKIVWVSLPGDASFTFSFKLTAPSTVSGSVNFAPQFFYLENSVKKEFNPTPAAVSFGGGTAVASTDNVTPTTTTDNTTSIPPATDNTTTTSTPADNSASNSVAVPSETTTTTEPATTNNTTTTSTPVEPTKTPVATTTQPAAAKSNVVYHVQLAALTNKPNKSKFAEYGAVKIVEDAGLYKVLVGSFKTLEEARKYKAQLIAKGTVGCFVVAYENGVRIKI